MLGNGTVRLVTGSILGALVACILCWTACYLLTKADVGFFAGKEEVSSRHNDISKASLNVYTIQHVKLTGSGIISDATGSKQNVFARIVLPYSIWTIIPIVALFIAFAITLKISGAENRKQALIATLIMSLIYALLLTVFAEIIHAPIDSVPIPEISGTSISPPAIDFTPSAASAFFYCLLLGSSCALVRWLLPVKKSLNERIGFMHPCAVSAFSTTLIVILILSFGAWYMTRNKATNSGLGFIELVPATANAVYSGLFGASIVANAESEMSLGGGKTTLFSLNANLYGNTKQNDGKKTESKPVPGPVKYGAGALVIFLGFMVGLFAVKKGSRDGFVTTTARVLLFQMVILLFLVLTTRLELVSSMKSGEFSSTTSVVASTIWSIQMLIPMLIFAVGSLMGAQLSRKSFKLNFDS